MILDKDLAFLYEVETKRLTESVKRNIKRFPADFMFQLTKEESDLINKMGINTLRTNSLRTQIATLENFKGKHSKYFASGASVPPLIFLSLLQFPSDHLCLP